MSWKPLGGGTAREEFETCAGSIPVASWATAKRDEGADTLTQRTCGVRDRRHIVSEEWGHGEDSSSRGASGFSDHRVLGRDPSGSSTRSRTWAMVSCASAGTLVLLATACGSGDGQAQQGSAPHEFGTSGAVIIGPDSNIVTPITPFGQFGIARYAPDGRLDPSFGSTVRQ